MENKTTPVHNSYSNGHYTPHGYGNAPGRPQKPKNRGLLVTLIILMVIIIALLILIIANSSGDTYHPGNTADSTATVVEQTSAPVAAPVEAPQLSPYEIKMMKVKEAYHDVLGRNRGGKYFLINLSGVEFPIICATTMKTHYYEDGRDLDAYYILSVYRVDENGYTKLGDLEVVFGELLRKGSTLCNKITYDGFDIYDYYTINSQSAYFNDRGDSPASAYSAVSWYNCSNTTPIDNIDQK